MTNKLTHQSKENLMQHKLMVLLTTLVLLSLLIAPNSIAQAQAHGQGTAPDCPLYEPSLLKDKSFWHSLPPECLQDFKTSSIEANRSAQAQNVQPMTAGGPDGFGYSYDDSVSYSWISASTNSGLTGDDEYTGPIDIGFNFPFYGMPQSQLYFSTNGLITFGAGSWDWSGSDIPNEMNPNNLIAPFWDDLRVGNPYNTGAIYYSQGGSAPNRYFVVEWRNVEYWDDTQNISFEAILHENGDIVFQYQSLPTSYWPVVAIEDSIGYDGLPYSVYMNVPLHAIRFTYPASAARVLVSPADRNGGFAPINGHKDFKITISNSGTLGADTYDLTITSNWPVTFYASNGITPLTDIDSDGVVDTGPLPQGTSTTIIARFSTPTVAKIGDNTTAVMIVKSSLNLSKTREIVLDVSVPAGFASVFQDRGDGSMNFMTVDSNQTNLSQVTTDNYFGYFPAVVSLPHGNYLFAWSKVSSNASNVWRDVEYVVLDRGGNIILPLTKLTNNSSTTIYTEDYLPSFAVAPNGTIGVVWYRYLEDPSTNDANYNLYFATISSSGSLLTGPTNITNNTTWGAWNEVPRFYSPTIATSDDNRFILGWEYRRPGTMGGDVNDIWYAVRSSTGTSVFPPTALTIYGWSWEPVLNSLTGGKVIMTWGEDVGGPYYAVINSNGTISTPKTSLQSYGDVYYTPDAVQLPNGKVGLAWNSREPYAEPSSGVELAILDSSYHLLQDPTFAPSHWHPSNPISECVSVTTDALSNVIMTWTGPNNRLLYALGNDTGTFVTEPMIYKTSGNYIDIGCNGQGNAPYTAVTFGDVSSNYWAWDFVERLYRSGITAGCGNGNYCPETAVTRAQMAVFLERGIHGSSYNPPPVGGSTGFLDVDPTYWAGAWIKQLAAEGITGGCGSGAYCPESAVTRAQMAVFLLRSKYGASYNPPDVAGNSGFSDVQPTYWAAAWIKQLVAEGITAGCGTGRYCPESPVTRAQMAVFLVRTFNLP
jgi:S-layer homology domain